METTAPHRWFASVGRPLRPTAERRLRRAIDLGGLAVALWFISPLLLGPAAPDLPPREDLDPMLVEVLVRGLEDEPLVALPPPPPAPEPPAPEPVTPSPLTESPPEAPPSDAQPAPPDPIPAVSEPAVTPADAESSPPADALPLVVAAAEDPEVLEQLLREQAIQTLRSQGLLALDTEHVDRTALDPGFREGTRRWDGLFGPRDIHILLAALEEGRVGLPQVAQGGTYTMGPGAFGVSGFLGVPMITQRIPAQREELSRPQLELSRKLRRELAGKRCALQLTVSAEGLVVGVARRDCPDALFQPAADVAWRTLWAASPRVGDTSVPFAVEVP